MDNSYCVVLRDKQTTEVATVVQEDIVTDAEVCIYRFPEADVA